MPRRRRATRRSAREWTVRGVVAAIVAGVGWISVSHTLGYTIRLADPAGAHRLAPGDGRVTAQLAQQLAGVNATAADRTRADQVARAALDQAPLAVAAVSTLGIDAQIRGDTAGARRLFAYAERVSRRDLQTQLWAVEDAVGRGDVLGALRHYDIALRTTRNAPELLFPVLVSALPEPPIRKALAATLAARPIWAADFIAYAAGNSPDPRATADLFLALRRAGVAVPEDSGVVLIRTLAARDLMDSAWSYYALTHAHADRRRSRDPRFTAEPASPSIFDWTPVSDAGTSATIQRAGRGGLVDFAAPASVGGPLLRQVQLLPPGEYRIQGHSIGINQPVEASPYWALTCADGRELGRVVVPNSTQANGMFAGRFSVPTGCPSQTLTLIARPSDAVLGLSGQIDWVELKPAS